MINIDSSCAGGMAIDVAAQSQTKIGDNNTPHPHTRRHSQCRKFAKSISTDGTEGKLTKNIQVRKYKHTFSGCYDWTYCNI